MIDVGAGVGVVLFLISMSFFTIPNNTNKNKTNRLNNEIHNFNTTSFTINNNNNKNKNKNKDKDKHYPYHSVSQTSIDDELSLPSFSLLSSLTTSSTSSSSSDLSLSNPTTNTTILHPNKKHKPLTTTLNSNSKEAAKKINSKLAEIIQTKINEIPVSTPTSRYLFNLRKVKKSILQCSTPIVSKSQLISEIKGIGPCTAKLFNAYFEEKKKELEKDKEKLLSTLTLNSNASNVNPLSTNFTTTEFNEKEKNELAFLVDEPSLPDFDLPPSTFVSSSSSQSSQSSFTSVSVNSTSLIHDTSKTFTNIDSTSTSTFNFLIPHSPSYAMLVSFFDFSTGVRSKDALLSESGLRSLAQPFTLSNLNDPGSWLNGIQLLLKHHLFKELRMNQMGPLFYCLTEKGEQVASRLSISPPLPPLSSSFSSSSSSSSLTIKKKKMALHQSSANATPVNETQEIRNRRKNPSISNESKLLLNSDSKSTTLHTQDEDDANVIQDENESDNQIDRFELSSFHGLTTTSTTYKDSLLKKKSKDPVSTLINSSHLLLDEEEEEDDDDDNDNESEVEGEDEEQSLLSKSTPTHTLIERKSPSSSSSSTLEPIFLPSAFPFTKPKAAPVTLILDTREHIANDRTYFQSAFTSLQLPFVTRALPIGDIHWVTLDDQVVNVIVERKRLDDLISSVQSSRFLEQIWRLKQSQAHIYYILETPPCYFPNQHDQSLISSCQAQLVYHGFHVILSPSVHYTVQLLHHLTLTLTSNEHPCEPNGDFFLRTQKKGHLPLQAIHTNMIQRMKGMSLSKTQWLIRQYPTLHELYEALLPLKHSSIDEVLQLLPFSDKKGLGQKKLGMGLILFLKQLFCDDVYND